MEVKPEETLEINLSEVNEKLNLKYELISDFIHKCESKLSYENLSEYHSKVRFLRKTYGMIISNQKKLTYLKKFQNELNTKNNRTNLNITISFILFSIVIFLSGMGVSTSVILMSGLILSGMILISNKNKEEQICVMKITSQEILQNNLERDFEEFNYRGRTFPLSDLFEIDSRRESEESTIIREEYELKGQIVFVRLIIDFLRKYPELKDLFNSSECINVLKDTNYQQLKKFNNN